MCERRRKHITTDTGLQATLERTICAENILLLLVAAISLPYDVSVRNFSVERRSPDRLAPKYIH